MRALRLGLAFAAVSALSAQTAEELVSKNLQAKGGIEKIKAIKSLRMTGTLQAGSFKAKLGQDAKAPDMLRQMVTIQGMTQIEAFDDGVGWRISPFEGRKDPELMGEDDLRGLAEDADFYGPLVDYKQKGNTIEYLGHDTVDGDDAYRLKVTLRNGDIVYYYLDPDTYIEIRMERIRHIRGSERESVTNLGSYKLVNGVYFPFSIESESKTNPGQSATITIDKIEANVPIENQEFKMPVAPVTPAQHGAQGAGRGIERKSESADLAAPRGSVARRSNIRAQGAGRGIERKSEPADLGAPGDSVARRSNIGAQGAGRGIERKSESADLAARGDSVAHQSQIAGRGL